jgi:signal peptidase I
MIPTLLVGDHIMVDKRRRPSERGDVIVFHYPLDTTVDYVKRVVGVGGDVVEIEGRQLIVNGVPAPRRDLERPCGADMGLDDFDLIGCELWEETLTGRTFGTVKTPNGGQSFPRTIVPAGHLFVLGDNRDNSSDSRVWGTVAQELVVGRVAYVWYSGGPRGLRWDRMNKEVR